MKTAEGKQLVSRKRTRWIFGFMTTLFLGTAFAVFLWYRSNCGPFVLVENQSGLPLTEVTLAVNGASCDWGAMREGASIRVRIRPIGDSAISLRYRTPDGVDHDWSGGFIQWHYVYRAKLIVQPDHTIKYEDWLAPRFALSSESRAK